jgi:hypothetical protein
MLKASSRNKSYIRKSTNNPTLQVPFHAEYHQKVVEALQESMGKGPLNQRKTLRSIEKAYTDELLIASDKIEVYLELIQKIITEGLSLFDDDKLFEKSIDLARNPSLVVFSQGQGLTPSFKEVANITMNRLQRKTMNILVEDDLKIEKLRHPKIMIFSEKPSKKKTEHKNSRKTTKMLNGPVNPPDEYMSYSFLETRDSIEFGLERIGEEAENNDVSEVRLIKMAQDKFKLVTMMNIKDFQEDLVQELIPYFLGIITN